VTIPEGRRAVISTGRFSHPAEAAIPGARPRRPRPFPARIVGGVESFANTPEHLPHRRLAPEPAGDLVAAGATRHRDSGIFNGTKGAASLT